MDKETAVAIGAVLVPIASWLGSYVGNKVHFAEFRTKVLTQLGQINKWQEKQEKDETACKARVQSIGDRVSRIEGKMNGYLSSQQQ